LGARSLVMLSCLVLIVMAPMRVSLVMNTMVLL
jgi:hypothetical protein